MHAPTCNATPAEHFLHPSHCTLHNPRFTFHTFTLHLVSNHVGSSHLISPHLIPSLLTCHQSKFFSTVFTSSQHSSTNLLEVLPNSSQLFCTPERSYYQREVPRTKLPLCAESFCTQKLETQMHLHRKALTKYFVAPLYYFVLQKLHKVC